MKTYLVLAGLAVFLTGYALFLKQTHNWCTERGGIYLSHEFVCVKRGAVIK